MTWSEGQIAAAICRQTLASKCVVLVDRCNWTGHECDVLAVTKDLRVIDIEIKISRADLKADAHKDKWWQTYFPYNDHHVRPQPRQWPRRVWKHYYAMPAEIWKPELLDCLASPKSGVLLMTKQDRGAPVVARCLRRATPNRNADCLAPQQVIDIARLANLRMWDAYAQVERVARGFA